MFGGDMTKMDPFTLSLLTNDGVLAVNQHSSNNRPLFDRGGLVVWAADALDATVAAPDAYLAVFNRTNAPTAVPVGLAELGLKGAVSARDLWTGGPGSRHCPVGIFRPLSRATEPASSPAAGGALAREAQGQALVPGLFGIDPLGGFLSHGRLRSMPPKGSTSSPRL